MRKIVEYNVEEHGYEYFGNVCDYDTVNQYLCCIKRIIKTQRSENLIDIRGDDIMTDRMED